MEGRWGIGKGKPKNREILANAPAKIDIIWHLKKRGKKWKLRKGFWQSLSRRKLHNTSHWKLKKGEIQSWHSGKVRAAMKT
jgi:hypothetical protein